MECMLCSHIMGQTKLDNIKKHHRSAHPKLTEMTASQREAARNRFDKMQDKGSKQLSCFMGPQRLIVLRSYRMYRLDESLDAIFNEHQDPVKFFCQLYQMEETRAFASLCILLLTIQPDICDLERGFSVMNYIKNQHRTHLTQEHLNAAVSVAMDSRSVSSFPFDKC